MRTSHYSNIQISAVSVCLPQQTREVDSYVDTFGEENISKFKKMTGVNAVSRALPEQTAADLGIEAGLNLFKNLKVDTSKIKIVVFVSQKPNYRLPSTAYFIHHHLNLSSDCVCFDINLACSGFIYGLNTVAGMLQSYGLEDKALLITADTSIKSLAPNDRTMSMLFGDSGSACLLSKTDNAPQLNFAFKSDGYRFKSIITPSGAFRNIGKPTKRVKWSDDIFRSDYDTHMKGMDVFGFSISDVPALVKDFLNHLNKTEEDYDLFALHQANKYILKQLSRKLKISFEKIHLILDRYGNNSSNSIPLVLADIYGENKEDENSDIFMSGFGAGLSWGCAEATINKNIILKIIKSNKIYD
ncbi:ketoacyl-ACP synthase III [Psychroflexus montanilacus]|uniref:ketoacyl-ACP synthase III n=1 Tax=Psychroflexus montanilacus TaxID=2873598 RepID=UPI001CC9B8EB|nr:ketoacyl-ACP synthase III [Psychroflexus montanilacus]MBZ9652558.1 ketoacyl-ACP synthase III [Psychroflexus montanilacus]